MLVIVDGINGSGKTSIIERFIKEYPEFKKIRMEDRVDDLGLISIKKSVNKIYGTTVINDFVEDLFIAEFINQTGVNAILDRSLISAALYRQLRQEKKIDKKIIDWWINRINKMGALYFWFIVSYDNMRIRSNVNIMEFQHRMLHSNFEYSYKYLESKLVKCFTIDTNEFPYRKVYSTFKKIIVDNFGL